MVFAHFAPSCLWAPLCLLGASRVPLDASWMVLGASHVVSIRIIRIPNQVILPKEQHLFVESTRFPNRVSF